MKWYSADLHLHSCLSPCGSLDSSPRAIAAQARHMGLDLIALTDHNSCLNAPAFAAACAHEGIACIFGAEVTCAEEAHCLCLFSEVSQALDFGAFIYKKLLPIPNNPEKWGDQIWVNEEEEVEGEVDLFLVSPTTIPLDDLAAEVHRRGGLFIPAHVDRLAMSLCSQLGFVPAGDFDALEIVKPGQTLKALGLPAGAVYPLICDSDAHHPDYIAQRHFTFQADTADFAGLKTALAANRIRCTFDIPQGSTMDET